MKYQKRLLMSGLALSFLFGLGASQAKEWEQSYVVNLNRQNGDLPRWGFSKDSIVGEYSEKYSTWHVSEFCVCDFMRGDCNHVLSHYDFFDFDQNFWKVSSKDGLKAGAALDLKDSSLFYETSRRDASTLFDSYVFESKKEASLDTNYFVYKKDSSYYALCQYITVYDTVVLRGGGTEYDPAYFAHQCIFQNDGTPTFSKIPEYSGELPKGKKVQPSSGFANSIRKPIRVDAVRKPYLVNGQSAKGLSAKGVRVEGDRIYRY